MARRLANPKRVTCEWCGLDVGGYEKSKNGVSDCRIPWVGIMYTRAQRYFRAQCSVASGNRAAVPHPLAATPNPALSLFTHTRDAYVRALNTSRRVACPSAASLAAPPHLFAGGGGGGGGL